MTELRTFYDRIKGQLELFREPNNEFLVGGSSQSFDAHPSDVLWLLKLGATGNIIWQKRHRASSDMSYDLVMPESVYETEDGSVFG